MKLGLKEMTIWIEMTNSHGNPCVFTFHIDICVKKFQSRQTSIHVGFSLTEFCA